MSEVPEPISQKATKMVVAGLVAVMVVGSLVWVYLESNAELLLDREKGGRFGAAYEKRCQASFEPAVCKKLAGMNHSTCMHEAGMKTTEEPAELEHYLTCMLGKQADAAP